MKEKNSLTTTIIVVICGFYFTAQYYPNILHLSLPLQQELFLIKDAYFPDGKLHGVNQGEYWRLITVALTHGSITHLLFNMLALWQLGHSIETIYGKGKYVVILLGSLLAGSAASYFFNPSNVPAVGASGMIFGLFAALLVTGRRYGIDYKNVISINSSDFHSLIKNMNNNSLDVMNNFTNFPYTKLKKDNYLHMIFLSEPEFWIFYMYDKDFLIFVKESWTDFKDLVNNYNEEEIKKELNFEDFENSRKNLQKMKLVTNLLQEMYPEIFN